MAEANAMEKQQETASGGEHQELRKCMMLRQQPRAAYAIRRWWQRLVLKPKELEALGINSPPWSPSLRAVLRRSETPEAAALTEGFRRLWMMQKQAADEGRELDIAAWTCVAMVLAEIGRDGEGYSFASAAGCENGDTGEPVVSGLRFQQLQDSQTPEELVRRLRRLLAMTKGAAISPVLLADDILLWFAERRSRQWPDNPARRLAFRWAENYFGQVARYKSAEA